MGFPLSIQEGGGVGGGVGGGGGVWNARIEKEAPPRNLLKF